MAQSSKEEFSAFTLRIPVALKSQIEARCKVQHRTRNAEIIHLLTKAIDDSVAADIALAESFNSRSKGPR